jgi:hypothetical protein
LEVEDRIDMDRERKNDWLGLLGLTAAGLFLFTSVYYAKSWASRPDTYSADPRKEKVVLALNEGVRIGSEKIIYRGLTEDGRLTMAVVLLKMDPEYPYIHEIGIREAKDGFSLVGHRFQLVSASSSRIRFWHVRESPILAMTKSDGPPPLDPVRLGPDIAWGP